MTARSRKTFEELISLPDLGIPLARIALLMACEEYPQLTLRPYLIMLDDIAGDVSNRLHGNPSTIDRIQAINEVLFDEYGFQGNKDNYYDPRNSFLNDVMDRRLGIPITLSAVYMEVAKRIDFRLEGLGIPGHFVIKHVSRDEETIIDPFNGGAVLTPADCRRLVHQADADAPDTDEIWRRRTTHREMVIRMLNNLRQIYTVRGAPDKALNMIELMILTEPTAYELYRDRGMLLFFLRKFDLAGSDLETYIKAAPDAEDRDRIEDHLNDIRRIRAMMN